LDSAGLTTEITKIIMDSKVVNIRSISLSENAGIFKGSITVIVPNNEILKKMMANIKKIHGVEKVTRINSN
jgi:GTP pyrophosphokinase